MIKAITTKPLDGSPVGAEIELGQVDFDRLSALGAVKAAPTVENKAAPKAANKKA